MATQNKELARQLLVARPQLPKALFQVLIHFFTFLLWFLMPGEEERGWGFSFFSFL